MPVTIGEQENALEAERLIDSWINAAQHAVTCEANGSDHCVSEIPGSQADGPSCHIVELPPSQASPQLVGTEPSQPLIGGSETSRGDAAAARTNQDESHENPRQSTPLTGSPARKRSRYVHSHSQESDSGDVYEQLQLQLQQVAARSSQQAQQIAVLQQQQQQLLKQTLKLERMCRCQHNAADWRVSGEAKELYSQYVSQEIGQYSEALTVSVRGGDCALAVAALSKMTVPEFASLWTDYISSLKSCLILIHSRSAAASVFRRFAIEASQLVGCVKLVNTAAYGALVQGKINVALSNTVKMDAAFYESFMTVMDLSSEQIQDLLYLRRIYYTRRAVLAEERAQLQQQLISPGACDFNGPPIVPLQRSAKAKDIFAKLKQNAEEDNRVYHRVMTALRRGIATVEQGAVAGVHSYPYMFTIGGFFEVLGAHEGAPSKEALAATSQTDDMTADWEYLERYLASITPESATGHVPLVNHAPQRSLSDMVPLLQNELLRKKSL